MSMISILRILIAIVLILSDTSAFSQRLKKYPTIPKNSNILNYNIISTFGAICDGINDDGPAFVAAGAAMASNPAIQAGTPVILTIPTGAQCTINTCPVATGRTIFYGIPNFTISGYGATISIIYPAPCTQWAGLGVTATNIPPAISALFNTVSAGASCVTMVTPGQESMFTVGSWVVAGNINLQIGGYPQNNQIFEYLQVASTGAGQVCFNTNTVNNYSAAYPAYGLNSPPGTGGNCGGSCGGPATLWGLYSGWNTNYTILGVTWNYPVANPHGLVELEFIGRNITMTDVSFPSSNACYTPSMGKTITLNNVYENCVVPNDKFIDVMNINGGNIVVLGPEAPSNTLNISNGAVIGDLAGAYVTTNCNNSTITVLVGARDYGAQQSFNGVNCNIGSISHNFFRNQVNSSDWTVSGGVFTHNTVVAQALTWPVPVSAVAGASYFFSNGADYEYFPITVTSLGYSAPNVVITTTLAGGLPPLAANPLYIAQEPYPNWNCTNCFGSNSAVDFSQAGAQNAKLFTYSNRIYTCANNVATVQAANPGVPVIDINNPPPDQPTVWGLLTSMTANVMVADTSLNATLPWQIGGKFNNFQVIDTTTGAFVSFGPVVSLKIAGTRVVTPTTVTGTQTGDTLSAPGMISSPHAEVPVLQTDISADLASTCPVVDLTWQTTR